MADSFLGEIRMFGGPYAPLNWAFCDGSPLPISEYDALYTLIGQIYGSTGTTFNLPDLRSRVPVHQYPGNGFEVGQTNGLETVALTSGEMPAHTHAVSASSASGNLNVPEGNVWASAPSARYSAQTPNLAMNPAAISPIGGGLAHDNMMPFLAVNFIISLYGYYPSQD